MVKNKVKSKSRPTKVRSRFTEAEHDYYSLSNKVYPIFAPVYDAVTFPFQHLRRQVAGALHPGRKEKVLDVATGTGAQAFAFAKTAGEVIGVDLSEPMLRVARRKNRLSNVTFRQGDATKLPFDDGHFDAACISFALHEMPKSIQEKVVAEMARVTKPGGTVAIVDYGLPKNAAVRFLAYHIEKLYEPAPYSDFVLSDLPDLLKKSGVAPMEQRPALFGFAKIVIGKNQGRRQSL